MLVYRICRAKYADKLDGKGAELYGGRWNVVGTPVVYTSSTRSLAALEVLAGLPQLKLPEGFVVVTVTIPVAVEILPDSALPANWQTYPFGPETVSIGTQWASEMKSLALSVPSSMVPDERNVLINPLHQQAHKAEVSDIKNFIFDERLYAWER